MDIGRKLKNMRIDNGDVLSDVAKSVGITNSVLSRMENGISRPSDRMIHGYCKRYMVNFLDFMREAGREVKLVTSVDGDKKYIAVAANHGTIGYLEVK